MYTAIAFFAGMFAGGAFGFLLAAVLILGRQPMSGVMIDAEELKSRLMVDTGMFTDELGFVLSLAGVIGQIEFMEMQADRPHGEWIVEHGGNGWNDWSNITCSVCGKKFERTDKTNFCPSCGADMRGDK